MNYGDRGGITVRVRKGTSVNVEEVSELRDDDPRVPDDRQVFVVGPKDMKVAIKAVDAGDAGARADVVLRCG